MGKHPKKPRQANRNHHDFSGVKKNFSSHKGAKKLVSSTKSKTGKGPKQLKPVIPFRPADHVLLLGEGDFSFALSLVEDHKCKYVTATCYDSEQVLHQKYPQTREILPRYLSYGSHGPGDEQNPEDSNDQSLIQEETGVQALENNSSSSEWGGFSPSTSVEELPSMATAPSVSSNGANSRSAQTSSSGHISFHASISAHHLQAYKPIRRKGPFNKIVFNFPHVGGLSTDVNRQVRANQELLVAFFRSCKPLLASRSNPVPSSQWAAADDDSDLEHDCDDLMSGQNQTEADDARAAGQVIVSLFDGEPYTLWNIRDLARHSGFKLVTSWRFPWDAYPGYRHARTLGKIIQKNDDAEVSSTKGSGHQSRAWKGEEREARGFVFEMLDDDNGRAGVTTRNEPKNRGQSNQIPRNQRWRSTPSSEDDI